MKVTIQRDCILQQRNRAKKEKESLGIKYEVAVDEYNNKGHLGDSFRQSGKAADRRK